MALSGSASTSAFQTRLYTVSWTATQSITNNTSTISWTLSCSGGTSSYYAERTLNVTIAGSTVYSKTARVLRYAGTIASGTLTVSHDSSGNKSFTISINAAVYYSTVNCTGSSTFTLNQIARLSTMSVSNGTLGTSQTLTVTRQSTSLDHSITYTVGGDTVTVVDRGTLSSYTFTPPDTLAKYNTAGTSVTLVWTIHTFVTSPFAGLGTNSYTATYTIPSTTAYYPTCSISVSDTKGYATTYGGYIEDLSQLKVAITADGAYGSSISSYATTVTGFSGTYTSSSFTVTPSSSGTKTISTTVKDTRNRSTSADTAVTVLAYTAPKISSLTAYRVASSSSTTEDDTGAYIYVKFSASITELDGASTANTKTFTLTNGSSSSTYTTAYSYTGQGKWFSATTDKSYTIKLTATDSFGSTSKAVTVGTAYAIIHWNEDGDGMGIGQLCTSSGGLQVGWDTTITGDLTVQGTPIKLYTGTGTSATLTKTGSLYLGYNGTTTAAVIPSDTYLYGYCINIGHNGTGTFPASTIIRIGTSGTSDTSCTGSTESYSSTTYVRGTTYLGYSDGITYLKGKTYDSSNQRIRNGLVAYTGSGDTSGINPNTTLEHIILTNHSNTPSNIDFWYIITYFYNSKSTSSNRMQTAYKYTTTAYGSVYYRVYYGGSWSDWAKIQGSEADPFSKGELLAITMQDYGSAMTSWESYASQYYLRFYVRTSSTTNTALGVIAFNSDERLKKNIKPTTVNGIDAIRQIEHISFEWRSNDIHQTIGYSAQQLESISEMTTCPVFDVEQDEEHAFDSLKQINETILIPYISKAVQELIEIVEQQEEEIEDQNQQIQTLTQTIQTQQEEIEYLKGIVATVEDIEYLKERLKAIESKLNS